MTLSEMLWMNSMMEHDLKEEFEDKKAFIEYLASFINPQAVKDLKNMANNTKQISDEDFAKTLAKISGGEVDPALIKLLNKG